MSSFLRGAILFIFIFPILSLRILNESSLNCTQQEVTCKVTTSNCLDPQWLEPNDFTPTGPLDLKAEVKLRENEDGDLVPVIVAQWKARDDGSIQTLNSTELEVMMVSTNARLCVRYTFLNKFPRMKKTDNEHWSFTLDQVVVDPEQKYLVAVSNIPKPNIQHSSYNINKTISVPGCKDPEIRKTGYCLKNGGLWDPIITVKKSTGVQNTAVLFMEFSSAEHSERYKVFTKCDSQQKDNTLWKNNSTTLNVTYDLERWPRTCCNFDVQIQPFFKECQNDCVRKKKSFNICEVVGPSTPPKNDWIWVILAGVIGLVFGIAFCLIYSRCRKREGPSKKPEPGQELCKPLPPETRTVLIIYSKDHPLYTEIVLKLCAFLRAKCGTEVVLDLLDTSWLGAIGRLPWLEQQKRRIEESSDKILVLCSRGVQAKWEAMCGKGTITLREDVRSPTGDTLTPALNLMLPDLQQAASFGKYMVAYFEDISSEHDVPSMFHIAVKYKLMKHFEELYFRILDLEKYQQGEVRSIEGIGIDEYFNCPSGRALRDAIETFQAHQLENSDWFEKECMNSEDEVRVESDPLLNQHIYPVLQRLPVYNEALPVLIHEVEVHQEDQGQSVYAQTPQINQGLDRPSVVELNLRVDPRSNEVYSSQPVVEPPPGVLISDVCPAVLESQPCCKADLHLQGPSELGGIVHLPQGGLMTEGFPTEIGEVQPSTSLSRPSPEAIQNLLALQCSLSPFEVTGPQLKEEACSHSSQEQNISQPVEIEETELEESSGKRQSRGSDQGYISKDSFDREEPPRSPMTALVMLQETLFKNSLLSSGFGTEIMGSREHLQFDHPN
ncbi:interleukin 17 receptor A1a [Chanos chanos]|uniref:Interleukin 17 receptor A1a n=1 Tax=Chanos chanos TaxID=29144 RepID=A0A6J2V0D9_CHACN|nr:interleukin-17 receptor A-like [Chanos chanos]